MKRILAAAALALLAAPPALAQGGAQPPQAPKLDLEQTTLLRCSAAFAIVASEQARGVKDALAYPPLGQKGKEYFVRAGARLMDAHQLTREQIEALLLAEVQRQQEESVRAADPKSARDAIMRPCLLSLDASGI